MRVIGSVFHVQSLPHFIYSYRDIFILGKGVLLSDLSWSHARRPGLDVLRMLAICSLPRSCGSPGRVGPMTSVSSV